MAPRRTMVYAYVLYVYRHILFYLHMYVYAYGLYTSSFIILFLFHFLFQAFYLYFRTWVLK